MRGCCSASRTSSWKDAAAEGGQGERKAPAPKATPAHQTSLDLEAVKGAPPPEEPAGERIPAGIPAGAGAYSPQVQRQQQDGGAAGTVEAEESADLDALDLLLPDDSPPADTSPPSAGSLVGHGTPAPPQEQAAAEQDAPRRSSAAGWPPLLRAASGGRRPTASPGEEAGEASKRFSATGSAAPALDTIREASSSQSRLHSADGGGVHRGTEWAPPPAAVADGVRGSDTERSPPSGSAAEAPPCGADVSSLPTAAAAEPAAGLVVSIEALLAGGGCAAALNDSAGGAAAGSSSRQRRTTGQGTPVLAGVLELLSGGSCVETEQQPTAAAASTPTGVSADGNQACAAAVSTHATAAGAASEPPERLAAHGACWAADMAPGLDAAAAVAALLGTSTGASPAPAAEAAPRMEEGVAAAVAALLGGDPAAPAPAGAAPEAAPGPAATVAASLGTAKQAGGVADGAGEEEEAGGHGSSAAHQHGSWGPPSLSSAGFEARLDDVQPAAALGRSLPAPAAAWGAAAAGNPRLQQPQPQPRRPAAPPPAAWQWDVSEAGEPEAGPAPAIYSRGLRQRQEAEARYVRLRQQREQEELAKCTFAPVLLRPAGTAARPGGAPSGSGGGASSGGGPSIYQRGVAQRQRAQERIDCLRKEQARSELLGCTFSPAVSPHSAALVAAGVRYGGGGARVRGAVNDPSGLPAGIGALVVQELEALHLAGLDAAAAAATLATSLPADGSASAASYVTAQQDSCAGAGQPPGEHSVPASEDSRRRTSACLAGTTAAALPPRTMRPASGAATGPAPSQAHEPQGSPLEALAGVGLPPALAPSPTAARSSCAAPGAGQPAGASSGAGAASPAGPCFDRLYAHACDLRERQRQAALLHEHQRQQEVLKASPSPRPFPRAQHSCGASPPLSRRSPPPSRPASAGPAGWAACAAAAQLGREGAAAQQMPAGPKEPRDFDSFLQRQAKFVQALEGKLERERQLSMAAQHATLSPGSQRILQRRQAARQRGAEGQNAADGEHAQRGELDRPASLTSFTIPAARGAHAQPTSGQVGMLPLLHCAGVSAVDTGDANAYDGGGGASAGAQRESGAGPAALADSELMCSAHSAAPLHRARPASSDPLPFRPAISERAAARPGRSPAELHAEWDKRQQKLELKRRLAEEAAVAACSFAPAISPAASPGGKLATTRPRISMQDLDGYVADLQCRREAKEAAATAAARAREERELASCTFQPNLAAEAPRKPSPRTPASAPPSVLQQVQALLESGGAGGGPMQA